MKQSSKNEIDFLGLMNTIQAQITALDKKVDALINRSLPESRPSPTQHERVMHKAICADCKKECTIPFKPSGDRPVYCQDCFSRRKVIKLSGMIVQEPQADKKKRSVSVKKSVVKKKPVPKKK
jgi:CxxC-x17-CxxC domain-containing protein